jgi:uncharacterized membrane protein YgaE (UPF0421/DUF939 family)
MKLGARIFKTGLAIIISIYIASMLEFEPIVLAPLGAIFALQPSVYRSYQSILDQVQGNLIGAVVALLLLVTLGNEPLVIGLASIIVIIIHLKLKIQNAITLALVSAVAIMESAGEAIVDINFALTRFALIMIGVFSAFIVNLMFVPPKYETKLFHKLLENTEDTIQWLKLITKHGSQHLVLKKDLERLEKERFTIDQFYIFYKEERAYLSKNRFKKARKLVAFRNMMTSLDKATMLLKTLHHYENVIHDLPEDLKTRIVEEIECLTDLHEHLLNIFIGKIRAKQQMENYLKEVTLNKVRLTNAFLNYFNEQKNDFEATSYLPLLGTMVTYSEELEHLNKLVNSYNNFHYEKIEEDESF